MTSRSSSGALEAVERIVNRGGEPEEVLSQVVSALQERAAAWVGIALVERGALELGPTAGRTRPSKPQRHPVYFEDETIAELWTSDDADPELCARIAVIISPYCLVSR